MLGRVYSILKKALVLLAICGLVFTGGAFAHANELGFSSHSHADFVSSNHDHSEPDEIGSDMSAALHCGSEILILSTSFLGIEFAQGTVQRRKAISQRDSIEFLVDPPPPRGTPIYT